MPWSFRKQKYFHSVISCFISLPSASHAHFLALCASSGLWKVICTSPFPSVPRSGFGHGQFHLGGWYHVCVQSYCSNFRTDFRPKRQVWTCSMFMLCISECASSGSLESGHVLLSHKNAVVVSSVQPRWHVPFWPCTSTVPCWSHSLPENLRDFFRCHPLQLMWKLWLGAFLDSKCESNVESLNVLNRVTAITSDYFERSKTMHRFIDQNTENCTPPFNPRLNEPCCEGCCDTPCQKQLIVSVSFATQQPLNVICCIPAGAKHLRLEKMRKNALKDMNAS